MNTEPIVTGHPQTDDTDLLVDTAQLAALVILENGGETFRAEETAVILCHAAGRAETEVFALPHGIFITAERRDGSKVSSVVRTKSRSTNLFKVERVNVYSRAFVSGTLSLEELNDKLNELRHAARYRPAFIAMAAGLSSAMFSLLFEETLTVTVLWDLAVTLVCAFVAQYVSLSSRLKNAYQFTVTFVASVLIGLIAVLLVWFVGCGNLSCIIIGSITPLLPGLSLTNAIRDTVMGDILSGTVRIVETLLVAVAIAGGIGLVLAGYVSLLGGVL